jgi:hypothetical protein
MNKRRAMIRSNSSRRRGIQWHRFEEEGHGQNKTPIRTPTGKRGASDQTLETLLSFKLEEMKHKKRKRERKQEKENQRKLEDYDLNDCDQWIEFAARFNAIKETFDGDAVRAALQFPWFDETSLLTAEEKRNLRTSDQC